MIGKEQSFWGDLVVQEVRNRCGPSFRSPVLNISGAPQAIQLALAVLEVSPRRQAFAGRLFFCERQGNGPRLMGCTIFTGARMREPLLWQRGPWLQMTSDHTGQMMLMFQSVRSCSAACCKCTDSDFISESFCRVTTQKISKISQDVTN